MFFCSLFLVQNSKREYTLSEKILFGQEIKILKTFSCPEKSNVDDFNSISIFSDLRPDYPIGNAESYIIEKAKEILPEGVNGWGFKEEAKTFAEIFNSMTILLVVAVFVMYMILEILYASSCCTFSTTSCNDRRVIDTDGVQDGAFIIRVYRIVHVSWYS